MAELRSHLTGQDFEEMKRDCRLCPHCKQLGFVNCMLINPLHCDNNATHVYTCDLDGAVVCFSYGYSYKLPNM